MKTQARWLTRSAVAAFAGAALLLAGCDPGTKIDGAYQGTSLAPFGLAQFNMTLTVKGDTAEITVAGADQVFPPFKVRRDGERFAVYENTPDDGLIFNIEQNHNTLTCNQCEMVHLPTKWERQL